MQCERLGLCLAGVFFLVSAASGCEGEVAATRCNSEVDCSVGERCTDGFCVEGGPEASPAVPEPDAVEPDQSEPGAVEPDAGEPGVSPEDGGPAIDDDGGPGADGGVPPVDGGPQDGGPTDGGTPVPPDWWDLRWKARQAGTLDLPAGNGRGALTLPVVIPTAFAEDPSLRIVVEGQSRPFDLAGAVAWVAMPTIGDAQSIAIALYRDGPSDVPAPHSAAAWPGALGVWHFDNDLLDRSGKELHGDDGGLQIADGVVGAARGFRSDTADGAVRLPAEDVDIVGGQTALTIAAWQRVVVNAPALYHDIVSISGHEGGQISNALLAMNSAGGYRLRARGAFGDEGLLTLDTPPALSAPEGQWAFVVGVVDFETQEMAIYLDGNLIEVEPIPALTPTLSGPRLIAKETLREVAKDAAIGGEDDGLLVSDSDVDELRLLSVALSASDIALLHDAESEGGLIPTLGGPEGHAETPPQVAGAVPEADAVIVLPGSSAVIDVRRNDPETLQGGTIAEVIAPPTSNGVDVRVLQDGRLEVRADSTAALGTLVFEVQVSDGKNAPQSASLDVVVDNRNRPRCAHITSVQAPGDQVEFTIDALATRGSFVAASAVFGSASVDGDTVVYTAPAPADGAPVADGLLVDIENDGVRCTAAISFDLRAVNDRNAPARQEDVDRWVDRFFRLPSVDGVTIAIDPVFVDIGSPVKASGPRGFVHRSTRIGTAFARYHWVDGQGRVGRSGTIELHTAHGVEGASFGQRMRVLIDDTSDINNDVTTVSGLVDLRGTPAELTDGVRFYAPGSRKELAATAEGTIGAGTVRYRVQFPRVYADTPLNYFWVYFDRADASPPPDDGVWADDIVGAWGLSESLEDQSGNGHDAVGPQPSGLDGIEFEGVAASPVTVPSLESTHLLYPVTVEVVFEPNAVWTANSPSTALVTRFAGGSDGNYHLVWANPLDYNFPQGQLTSPAFMAKDDPLTSSSNFYAYQFEATVDDDTNVVTHVMSAPAETDLFLNGSAQGSQTAFNGEPLDGLLFDAPWAFGPGSIDDANVPAGRLDTHASIRSVRIWNRALSPDHIRLTSKSERFTLLTFEPPEPAP